MAVSLVKAIESHIHIEKTHIFSGFYFNMFIVYQQSYHQIWRRGIKIRISGILFLQSMNKASTLVSAVHITNKLSVSRQTTKVDVKHFWEIQNLNILLNSILNFCCDCFEYIKGRKKKLSLGRESRGVADLAKRGGRPLSRRARWRGQVGQGREDVQGESHAAGGSADGGIV